MPKPKRTPKGRRPGWGRPINFDLPNDTDALLEAARVRLGLDRVSYVRMILSERLNADARQAA